MLWACCFFLVLAATFCHDSARQSLNILAGCKKSHISDHKCTVETSAPIEEVSYQFAFNANGLY